MSPRSSDSNPQPDIYVGLLFVSVSIAPERVFGKEAEAGRQAQALSAFTALANIFFISFGGLIPDASLGVVVTIVAIPAILQTLALLGLVAHWRNERTLYRGVLLFLASAFVYGFELVIGIKLWQTPSSLGWLSGLLDLLLGAPRGGILFGLLDMAFGRLDRTLKPSPQVKEPPSKP